MAEPDRLAIWLHAPPSTDLSTLTLAYGRAVVGWFAHESVFLASESRTCASPVIALGAHVGVGGVHVWESDALCVLLPQYPADQENDRLEP